MWSAVLIFMLTAVITVMVAATAAILLMRGQTRLASRFGLVLLGLGGAYWLGIIGVAAVSRPTIIALGGEKHICEIDCHIAYSVVGVTKTEAIGAAGAETHAAGEFYVITVRTRFDPNTISERRSETAPLLPGPRDIELLDEAGNHYGVSAAGQAALHQPEPSARMLTRSLIPGEEFTTQLVFDVPTGARNPMLLIKDTDVTKWVLLGSETFPLHRKALFRLTPGPGVRDFAS